MLGTRVKCPNKVDTYAGYLLDKMNVIGQHTCGYEQYDIVGRNLPDGFDPLAVKVKCRACQFEYWVFPAVKYEDKNNG
jgi:hypothetical protein